MAATNLDEVVLDVIGRSMSYTNDDEYLIALRRLPKGQRALWATWIVQCEVGDSGLRGYFWNIEQEGFYEEAINGFMEIGATNQLAIFKSALDTITPFLSEMHEMQGEDDYRTRYNPLLKEKGIYTSLNRYGAVFWDATPELVRLRENYIRERTSELVKE